MAGKALLEPDLEQYCNVKIGVRPSAIHTIWVNRFESEFSASRVMRMNRFIFAVLRH